MTSIVDLPDRFISWLANLVNTHFKTLLGIGLVLYLASVWGIISIPGVTIPLWARVILTFFGLSTVGGYLLASYRYDEPEPDWNWVIEVNFDDPQTPRISKATDAVIADMTVVKGRLRQPEAATNVYVCRWWNKDPEQPLAHSTWRDLPDDAELLGVRPSAIEDEIVSLRDTYEGTHGKHKWVLDHLYMVVRKLDFRRSKSQDKVLEDHLSPSFEDESIADAVDAVIPEEIRPDRFDNRAGTTLEDELTDRGRADDAEPDLEDVDEVHKRGGLPVATDGGDDERQ